MDDSDRMQEEKLRDDGDEFVRAEPPQAGTDRAAADGAAAPPRWWQSAWMNVETKTASEVGDRMELMFACRCQRLDAREAALQAEAIRTRSVMGKLDKRMRDETTARNAVERQTTEVTKGIENRLKDLELKGTGGNEKKESHESAAASPSGGIGWVPRHIILGDGHKALRGRYSSRTAKRGCRSCRMGCGVAC